MFSIGEIFAILLIHWIADFILQTDKQAKGKSKNWKDLISHTSTYSMVTAVWWGFIPSVTGSGFENFIYVFLITFISHTITDYFTSRLNSRLWAKGDVHNFFVSVGFDQLLHYAQLFITFILLIK